MQSPQVTVVGSIHIDFFVRVPRLPRPGETIKGHGFLVKPGGKGANQAVGCGRLGARTFMVGKIGREFRELLLDNFRVNNVSTEYVYLDDAASTGVAFILLSDDGENMIAFDPGADYRLQPGDVEKAEEAIRGSRVVLTQLEIPIDTVGRTLELAKKHGAITVLNPAPAAPLPSSLLENADILTPNRVEASVLAGVEVRDEASALSAARKLLEMGVGAVIVTLGAEGAIAATREAAFRVPAVRVKPVDTTGAGDAFNAGLAYGLAKGLPLLEAVRLGNIAAALKVLKVGAQDGLPWLRELEEEMPRLYPQTSPVRLA